MASDEKKVVDIAAAVSTILSCIEEKNREGIKDTPARVAKMYLELTAGLRTEPPEITFFDRGDADQMVSITCLDYYSLCEHHLVPFYGKAHIGYLPDKKIAGLSKFGRIVDWFASRPQTQEHMTASIANHLAKEIEPAGLIVVVEGTHLCMSMRGVKKPNHITVTSAIRGKIDRNEFFDILKIERGMK